MTDPTPVQRAWMTWWIEMGRFCYPSAAAITYLYPEDSRERLAAEEWITDKQAMNKDQTKIKKHQTMILI